MIELTHKLREAWRVDLRALAALRIGVAGVILFDLAVRATDFTAHYGEGGVLPRALLWKFYPFRGPLSLHTLCVHPLYQAFLFLLAALFAFFLLIGWKTRWMSLFSWILLLSLHLRNPLVLHSGDNLLRLLVMWLMFFPAGACWSVDARGFKDSAAKGGRIFSAGTAALFMQVVILYLSTALLKWQWPGWRTGEGLYQALSSDFWSRAPGMALLAYPRLLKPLGLFVLCAETVGPLLLFVTCGRLRDALVGLFALMQAGFATCLYVGIFPWVSTVAMLPFLSSRFWDGLERRLAAAVDGPRSDLLHSFVLPRLSEGLAVLLMSYLLVSAVETVAHRSILPRALRPVEGALGLYTPWTMFTGPQRYRAWFVLVGTRSDGRQTDLRTGETPVRWEKPAVVSRTFPNMRWAKFHFEALGLPVEPIYKEVARFYGQEWNRRHPDAPVDEAQVFCLWQPMMPMYNTIPAKPWLLGKALFHPEGRGKPKG